MLLLFSCSAWEKGDQRNEGSGDVDPEQQQPQEDNVQAEDSTDISGKIVLDGISVRWDEFPMPTAEAFGLTGMRLPKFINPRYILTYSGGHRKM